jgi:hypothetical protein
MWPLNSRVSLPFGDLGAVAGGVKNAGMPAPPARNALGERALRVELDLELAAQEELLEQLVLAHVGRNPMR